MSPSPNTPLSIAVSATKDKLQASAHDIWTSIRSLDEYAKKPSATEDAETPKAAEGTVSASLERIEHVFKVMFSSCTSSGMQQASAEAAAVDLDLSEPYEKPRACSIRSSEFVSQKDLGDHVYAQLFMDDQAKATRAVEGLREQDSRQKAGDSFSRQFQHPFPASSPGRKVQPIHSVPTTPPTAKDIDIAEDFSFDDGISAISAHTLDDMARVQENKGNSPNKMGLFGRPVDVVEDIPYPLSSRSRRSGGNTPREQSLPPMAPVITPVKFTRGRSTGTHASKATRSSRCTRSTSSTQDSEFAHVWHKQEQAYWDDVVEQDKKNGNQFMTGTAKLLKTRRRSRCGSYSTTKDHTVATASSSSYASSQLDKHFPDDAMHCNTRGIVADSHLYSRDSELCEI